MTYLLNVVIKFAGLAGNVFMENFLLSVLFASLIAILSLKFKFLTKSGIAVTFFMAILIFSLGSWKWTVPMFTFFLFSSFLSKIREKSNKQVDTFFEKTGQRDYMQVIANGGFASIIAAANYFWPSELFYAAYVSSIASVCSDTWATEIGTMSRYKTYNLLTFRKTEQGISGGVSFPGFAGAAAGAIVIALSSLYWVNGNSFVYILLILIAGFIASIIDSILGSTLQVQYKCKVCSKITEKKQHCNAETEMYHGQHYFNNDVINLISGTAGAVIGYIITDLILY